MRSFMVAEIENRRRLRYPPRLKWCSGADQEEALEGLI